LQENQPQRHKDPMDYFVSFVSLCLCGFSPLLESLMDRFRSQTNNSCNGISRVTSIVYSIGGEPFGTMEPARNLSSSLTWYVVGNKFWCRSWVLEGGCGVPWGV